MLALKKPIESQHCRSSNFLSQITIFFFFKFSISKSYDPTWAGFVNLNLVGCRGNKMRKRLWRRSSSKTFNLENRFYTGCYIKFNYSQFSDNFMLVLSSSTIFKWIIFVTPIIICPNRTTTRHKTHIMGWII